MGVGAINWLLPIWKGNSIRPAYRSDLALLIVVALFCLPCGCVTAEELADPYSFKLGPGDHIQITVFSEENLSMDFRLNDTGTLNYPFLGELKVAGLSVVELEQLITDGLTGPYLVDPDVTVSIKEYRPFFLHGEVQEPGGIAYQPGLTLQKAIALAGGFTERAAKRKITVIRSGDPVARRITPNDPVRAGDVITVHQSFF